MEKEISLYIHIPFCRKKCSYCSFTSYEKAEELIPLYLKALKNEIDLRLEEGHIVKTIFFGGGTPSLLKNKGIESILNAVRNHCEIIKNAEITLEANPESVNIEYLKELLNIGINRLSFGIQSFNDDELKILGRIHSANDAENAFLTAREAGFKNINIDLIYGVPTQTEVSWDGNLQKAKELMPEHISLYGLSLEEGVFLKKQIESGLLESTPEDTVALLYEKAEKVLEDEGYEHYEISNWAKKGYECKHNLTYWQGGEYLGFGVSAHSYTSGVRLGNTSDINEYIKYLECKKLPPKSVEENLTEDVKIVENIILGLRLGKGLDIKGFEKKQGVDIIKKYEEQLKEIKELGLIEIKDGSIRLTAKGRLLGNEVFYRFLP